MSLNAFKPDTEEGQWVTVRRASHLLNVSEKTVYNRVNRGEYESRDTGKTTDGYLGSEVLAELSEAAADISESLQKGSELQEELYKTISEQEAKLSEKVLELSEAVLKMQEKISERDNTISNLHEVIKRKFLPAVFEEPKPDETLLQRLEELEARLSAKQRPWWRFWE